MQAVFLISLLPSPLCHPEGFSPRDLKPVAEILRCARDDMGMIQVRLGGLDAGKEFLAIMGEDFYNESMGDLDILQLNDDELYRLYLSGRMEAGDELMLRHGNGLTAYISSFLKSPSDAEDLMFDCFTVILVDRPGIAEGCFKTYLYRIARNKACTLWKRLFRKNDFILLEELTDIADMQPDLFAVTEASPEEEMLLRERDLGLRNALNRIAP